MIRLRLSILFLPLFFLGCPLLIFPQNGKDFVKLKAKIGFVNGEDRIKEYKFSEDGRQLSILGDKNIQLWDVESGKLISSLSYSAQQYPSFGKLAAVLSLGLSTLFKIEKIENNPRTNYFVAVEGDKDNKIVVVRQIDNGKQLAVLPLSLPLNSVSFEKSVIITRAKNKKETQLGVWDNVDFQQKGNISINEYEWHHLLKNEEKILIGSGNTKIDWFGYGKQGGKLEIRDVKSGLTEKKFIVPYSNEKDFYYSITLTPDEKFLMARRDNRIFVWEIDGQNLPKYIIESKDSPKGDLDLVKVINQEFIVARVDKRLRVYSIAEADRPKYEFVSANSQKAPKFLGNSADGKYFAVENNDKVLFYEINGNGQPLGEVSLADKESGSTRCLPEEDYCILKNNRQDGESHKTYLYNIRTGKVDYEIPLELGAVKLSPNKNLLYAENTGSFFVWNLSKAHSFSIPVKTYTKKCKTNSDPCLPCEGSENCTEEKINTEFISFSPNGEFFVKFGEAAVSLYNAETGKIEQNIFDPQKVIYGKNGVVRDSGYEWVEFSKDGKYLFTLNESKSSFGLQTITIWDLID